MKRLTFILITAIALMIIGCEENFFKSEPENNPEALFEDLWREFDIHYAPFEERGVNWDEQYSIYRPQVNALTTDEELLEIFKQMIGSLDDCHTYIIVPDQEHWKGNRHVNEKIEDELFNLDLIKTNYLNNDFTVSGYDYNTYGWIGDIGYIHMLWVTHNMFEFEIIIEQFKDAEGLIIDYRHNGGGTFMWGYENMGRLTDKKRLAHRSKTKNGIGDDDYTEWFDWYIEPKGEYFDKPIVYLTDRYTISAGERMTYAMKSLPNVLHMGDTTNGSISSMAGRDLANGWKYSIVPQKIEGFDGVYYEGVGIPPEVYIKNTFTEMSQGIDRTLEAAIARLND